MSSQDLSTRHRILDAAWNLLEAGGSAVRMSDIAKRAGVSRQAVYLHFANRADLLVATTRHVDEVKRVADRLAPSRAAATGPQRLATFVAAWGNYIPEIYGVARALMAMQDSDVEARQAWADRMQAVRAGCAAAVSAIEDDGLLRPELTAEMATDLLWMLVSVPNWEQLTRMCGWTQAAYVERVTALATQALIRTRDERG